MKPLKDDDEKQKRNNNIRALRGKHLPHELALMFNLSRQQIHNILRKDPLQLLLDRAAYHSNMALKLETEIRQMRGAAPSCFGLDDCSTQALSQCPWRMDCGN